MDQGGTGMKKKKLISLLLAATCIGSMALTGWGEKEKGGGKAADTELPADGILQMLLRVQI